MNTPEAVPACVKSCYTCRSMATHEDCDKDGGCLNTAEDYAKYRASGVMPPMRYRHWIESNPMEQIERLHAMQLSGARNIILGPGEAEVNTKQTPEEASAQLHDCAEQCGYMVGRLTDAGEGLRTLAVYKDYGPFRIEWKDGKLDRIVQGGEDGKKERTFWSAARAW